MSAITDYELRHYTGQEVASVHELLLDIHDEVYAGSNDPLAGRAQFAGFLDHWAAQPYFDCVVGFQDGQPVGYSYGAPLSEATTWWAGVEPPPDTAFVTETGTRTFALSELMVRAPWRGVGCARYIHDELLAGRSEERVTLLVHQEHPKVLALYEAWGYQMVGETTPPFPGAPELYAMVLPLNHA